MTDLQLIENYVLRMRAESGVTELGYEPRREMSAEAFPGGEIALLIEQQLIYTHFGHGSWRELNNPNVLQATLAYIRRVQS